jgi:hypothetical protein
VAVALPDPDEVRSWPGKPLLDRAGRSVGRVTQVYTDDATGVPEWALARLGNLAAPVPLVDAVELDGSVRVSVLRDEVMLAPHLQDDRHITPDEEERLYSHYGIEYAGDRSHTLLPAGEGPAPARTGQAPVVVREPAAPSAVGPRLRRASRGLLVPVALLVAVLLVGWARARRHPAS